MTHDELAELMRRLIDLGEDQSEMSMWYKLYDILSDQEKEQLVINLQKELKELENS
jgi:hypothetical protein